MGIKKHKVIIIIIIIKKGNLFLMTHMEHLSIYIY